MKIDWKKDISMPKLSLPRRRGRQKSINSDVGGAPTSRRASFLSRPSWLRRPELPAMPSRFSMPKRSGTSGRSPRLPVPKTSLKVPKPVGDLYADLRDRRLLPLVALLLVALVAAPILLKDKTEKEPSTPPIAAEAEGSTSDSSFAVVPAESGLRDYRKRLGFRAPRDPFGQPTKKKKASAKAPSGGAEESSGATSASPEPSTPAESTSVTSSGSGSSNSGGANAGSESPSGSESSPEAAPTGEPTEAAPGASTSSTTNIVVEKTVTGYLINAKYGFLGKVQPQTDITEMTKLPSPKQPILVYLGVSKDKKGALFLLGSQVTAYYGQGKCTLDKQSCSVLELQPGKSATLAYGIEEERFKITLEKIQPLVETSEKASTVTEQHAK